VTATTFREKAAAALWNLAYQNASGAAAIVEIRGIEPLEPLVVNGTQEQKLCAAGVQGFLDPDLVTKAIVAANGGMTVLLEFIRGSNDDGDIVKGLVALQSHSRGSDDMVRASLEAADGFALLSNMTISSNQKIKMLASGILSDLLDGTRLTS